MPAFCSPLNGVTVGTVAPGSQPRLNGTLGSLNQTPRWYWWVGENVVVPPSDTENVSASKMPLTVALPNPLLLAWMSLWYQEMPNGAVGCWMTNRSKPALGGMPCRLTVMVSLSAPGVMVTCPPAFGRQAEMADDDGLSANENDVMVTELYRRYRGPLLLFVLRLTAGDKQHAEDIVQETMVRAWREADRLDLTEPSLMPWLATVARRIVIDEQRRKRVRPS